MSWRQLFSFWVRWEVLGAVLLPEVPSTAPQSLGCCALQSKPYPRHQQGAHFHPAIPALHHNAWHQNWSLERHPVFTKRLLGMQTDLLCVCAYTRHKDINIQPHELQEPTLTVRTRIKWPALPPQPDCKGHGNTGTQKLVFRKPEHKRLKKTLTHCFPNAFGRACFKNLALASRLSVCHWNQQL